MKFHEISSNLSERTISGKCAYLGNESHPKRYEETAHCVSIHFDKKLYNFQK
jgi:hypothetical protein